MGNFQNTPGNMLPTNLESGPTSEQRTDAEIDAVLKAVNKAQYNYNSFRGKDKAETYAEYTKRVDGLVDFVVLTEEQWRKETGQKTQSEEILADLGLTEEPSRMYVTDTYLEMPTGPLTDEETKQLNDWLGLNVEFPFDPCEVSLDIPVGTVLVPLRTPVLTEPTAVFRGELDAL